MGGFLPNSGQLSTLDIYTNIYTTDPKIDYKKLKTTKTENLYTFG
jgi:hypothetical protein